MAGDEVELLDGPAEDLGGLPGDVAVGRAVEAVAPDAQLLVEGVGQAVDEGLGGNGLVEGRVEDGRPGGRPGRSGLAGLDALEVVRVVQRGELDALADRGLDLVRDQDGVGEILAAVDDPVPDAVDLGLVMDDAVLGCWRRDEDDLDGHARG